jgi:hypothetical protein
MPHSSQLFSTDSRTRFVYSFLLSLYRFEASTLAGELVLGSCRRLETFISTVYLRKRQKYMPLNTGKHRRHIISRTPPILKDVQAKLARGIYVWMEHVTDELDGWRFIWILFFKMHHESKGPVFERGICRSDDDGVPVRRGVSPLRSIDST